MDKSTNDKTTSKQKLRRVGLLLAALLLTIPLFVFAYYLYVYRTHISIVLFFFIYVIIILFIVAFIFISLREFYAKINVEYLEMQRRAALRQERSLRTSQADMERQMEDVKKHLRQIDHLLKNGQLEEARHVCGDFSSSFQSVRYKHYCDNDILDVILHGKETECHNLGITFSCDILFPEKIGIPAPTFISLFFNLLNNGIESCETSGQPSPFLRHSIDYKNNFLFIHMENTKNPAVVFDHTTTKADTFYHGLGLSIIEEIVRKRDGVCQWQDHGDTFISDIMIDFA